MTLPMITIPGVAEQWAIWVDLYSPAFGGATVAVGPFDSAAEAKEWKATADEHPPPNVQVTRAPCRWFPPNEVDAGIWP